MFAARLIARMEQRGVSAADLARLSGAGTSTVSNWTSGRSYPNSEQIFRIADILRCPARWLLTGTTESALVFDAEDVEWATLPRYDLALFTPEGKPAPDGQVPLPRHWLKTISAPTDKLWVTTVPGNVGNLLVEGEEIVCADAEGEIVDGRIYIFLLDLRPIIRRVIVTAKGYDLVTGDPMTLPLTVPRNLAEDGPYPVARAVGRFRFNPM